MDCHLLRGPVNPLECRWRVLACFRAPDRARNIRWAGRKRLPYDGGVEIELSVTFAPELGEAVRAAAEQAGLSLSDWMARAAEAKIQADWEARILKEAEQERRFEALREALDEYHAEYGPFTDEQMAEASRKLGLPWPPEENE